MLILQNVHPLLQALLAGCFTWSITALGSLMVYFFRKPNQFLMDAMLGFAAGVMIAASCWSLLIPALELSYSQGMNSITIVSFGFLSGGFLLFVIDQLFSAYFKSTQDKRAFMLITSITLHNIPEGLAVGVGFGSIMAQNGTSLAAALLLTLGIGLQNFPEGTAVSVPLFREGMSRHKAFFYGQLSGLFEPLSAILGAYLVLHTQRILPFMLSFAAGTMIYVVVEELIPESQSNQKKDFMALFTLLGFVTMMILDVIFA